MDKHNRCSGKDYGIVKPSMRETSLGNPRPQRQKAEKSLKRLKAYDD
ncbi:MAG: hypothetical protein NC453_10580 [Muribaculum sp.]|nr:hypothetical protein [Muribaculum sp.]